MAMEWKGSLRKDLWHLDELCFLDARLTFNDLNEDAVLNSLELEEEVIHSFDFIPLKSLLRLAFGLPRSFSSTRWAIIEPSWTTALARSYGGKRMAKSKRMTNTVKVKLNEAFVSSMTSSTQE